MWFFILVGRTFLCAMGLLALLIWYQTPIHYKRRK